MYIVTRADLSPGMQAAQAAHAAVEFTLRHQGRFELISDWNGFLIILAASDESELRILENTLFDTREIYATYHEPDLPGSSPGGSLTAVAFVGPRRLAQRYPLALQEERS